MDKREEAKNSFSLLVVCSAITVALWFIPFAGILTYPFRMFVTLIHETGHALAALVTFGGVYKITLDWSGNGLTWTNGGIRLFVSSAGYLGATMYGAALLLVLRRVRYSKLAAASTAVLLLLITVLLGGNITVWAVGLFWGVGLLVLAKCASANTVHFLMSFLAVQSLLNSFYDLRTLIFLSAFDPHTQTDAQNMAHATHDVLPAIFWSLGWALISLGVLVLTLTVYYRSLRGGSAVMRKETAFQ